MFRTARQFGGAVSSSWVTRTWKRETAVYLLVIWTIVTIKVIVFPSGSEYISAVGGLYATVTYAVFGFAMGAFGLDALAKQLHGQPVLPPTPPAGS